uniref:Ubiquitin-conjugating enzyme E2 L3-like n=1 Tax=Cynoglossus semilaevis TaxID=244447 RepID=A0A3P8WZ94_CYNSE
MAASRRLAKELDEIRKSGMKNFRNIQVDESNLLSWQGLIVPVHSGLKSFSRQSIPLNLPRSHSRQRSIIPTSMRRVRFACLSSVLRTGSLPPKLTKVLDSGASCIFCSL